MSIYTYQEKHWLYQQMKEQTPDDMYYIYRLIKKNGETHSVNSNGVFFDLSRVPKVAFQEIQKFLIFCQANRKEFEERDREMETSRLSLGETLERPKAMQTTLSREWQLYSQSSTV